MKRLRPSRIEGVMDRCNIPEDVPIESKIVSIEIRGAQTQIEAQNAEIRRACSSKYDEGLNSSAPGHLRRAPPRARRRRPERPGHRT